MGKMSEAGARDLLLNYILIYRYKEYIEICADDGDVTPMQTHPRLKHITYLINNDVVDDIRNIEKASDMHSTMMSLIDGLLSVLSNIPRDVDSQTYNGYITSAIINYRLKPKKDVITPYKLYSVINDMVPQMCKSLDVNISQNVIDKLSEDIFNKIITSDFINDTYKIPDGEDKITWYVCEVINRLKAKDNIDLYMWNVVTIDSIHAAIEDGFWESKFPVPFIQKTYEKKEGKTDAEGNALLCGDSLL